MIFDSEKTYTKYTKPLAGPDIVDFVYDSQACKKLFDRLRALGVVLSISGDGLAFDAPEGVLTAEIVEAMRAHRGELIRLLSEPSGDTESFFIPGVVCPYCRHDRFVDEPSGWRCRKCERLAWGWLGRSVFVRADFVSLEL